MFDELNRHKVAYTFLILLLLLHVGFFLMMWPDKNGLRIASFSMSFTYFCWGVFAHVKAQHINKRIVIEYFFTALLAGGMLFFLTW
ncbi:MAG: hypothetical protein ABI425_01520 [Patescibacteria group bacterium]